MPPLHRIGLFGGTFDPVHDGHVHLANLAREALTLDEVRFIPCRISPHKSDSQPTAPADRLEMLHRALADAPWAVVDDRELSSAEPSYSYLTAQSIAAEFPGSQCFWIMGADQWQALPKWKKPETLAGLVEFIVLARDGQEPAARDGYRLHVIHGEHPASATAIRNSVATRESAIRWLHPQVVEWVGKQDLYKNHRQPSPAALTKSGLRREMRETLKSMPAPLPDVASEVAALLGERPGLRRIAFFSALPGEPDLLALPATLPNLTWCYPRVVDSQTLAFHQVNHADELRPSTFGILEPTESVPMVPIDTIDAFLCPGLAFDRSGGRLGRGRGYYDRMLANARADALKIGVCFARQIVASTFPETHDVRMDVIICENGIATPEA